jgi:acetolactate synthase I/III small subunit
MIIALTGSLSKMNAFVELLEDFNITEIARTGITGLARGSADMNKM